MLYQAWRWVSLLGTHQLNDPLLRNRVIFSNQINLCVGFVILLYAVLLTALGHIEFSGGIFLGLVGTLLVAVANGSNRYYISRLLLILYSLLAAYYLSSYLDSDTGIFLFYYTVVLFPVILFEQRERLLLLGSIVFVIIIMVAGQFGLHPANAVYELPAAQAQWIRRLSIVITSTGAVLIFSLYQLRVSRYLLRFIKDERVRNEQLQAQEEELRQNAEEMQATQDEMRRVDAELRRKNEQLATSSQRMTQAQDLLREALAEVQDKQRTLKRQAYFDQGVAELTSAMHWEDGVSLNKWATGVLSRLLQYAGASQGALFVAETTGEGEQMLRRIATHAHTGKEPEKVLSWGEGFPGQAAKSRSTLHLKELTEQNMSLQLAYGNIVPNSMVVFPLINQDRVEGVAQVASLKPFAEQELSFFTRVAPLIAANLETIRSQTRIRALLAESEHKTRQLEENESLLHRNIEKLVVSQRDMKLAQKQLERNEEQLRDLNETLERRVQERTQELQRTLNELQETQVQLVQSEKMASLGQLIAGIAHEINTPIGAIKASADNIHDLLGPLVHSLPKLLDKLPTRSRLLFEQITESILASERQLTSKEERTLRKTFSQQLVEKGVEESDEVARRLVEAGFLNDLAPFLGLFVIEQSGLIVDNLFSIGQLKVNADNIALAVEKTRKIVFALKNYVYRQRDNRPVPVNLIQNLDTILTLYHNQLKYSIDVVTTYEDVPSVEGFPDELGQVWTNLLHNALQAMQNAGRLEVVISYDDRDPERVCVRMIDDGPGIPADVLPNIFEPFYTTKRRGEGTGLGLHLVQQIVHRHHGTIAVDTKPGRTCFTVSLPINQPSPIEPLVESIPNAERL